MSAYRPFARRSAIVAGLFLAIAASSAQADIPVGPPPTRPATPPPAPVEDAVEAPLKVTISKDSDARPTIVIPRRFMEQAAAAGLVPASESPKSNSLPAILGTIAGGGALSLGVLLLGVYFLRRSHRRAQTAIAGTTAVLALFIGAGVVFGDLLPFSRGNRPPREPELPNVKIVIADEGEAIELTLPKGLVESKL